MVGAGTQNKYIMGKNLYAHVYISCGSVTIFMGAGIFIIILREWIISKMSLNYLHKAIHLMSATSPRLTTLGYNRHFVVLMIISRICTKKTPSKIKDK